MVNGLTERETNRQSAIHGLLMQSIFSDSYLLGFIFRTNLDRTEPSSHSESYAKGKLNKQVRSKQ